MSTLGGITIQGAGEILDRPDYGRWLLHGPQGAGKTRLASTVAQFGKTLFVDLVGEKGTRSFQGTPWAENIDVARPSSITQLDDLFWALDKGGHGYQAVVVDSLTSVQSMAMRFLLGHSETAVKEIRKGIAGATQQTWGQTLDIMKDHTTFWYGLADGNRREPMHVVMTAQTKVLDDELTGTVKMRNPDVQKGALSVVAATPDYVLYCDIEENEEAFSDESLAPTRHIVRFGAHPGYKTKARVPSDLEGRIPHILGRGAQAPDLAVLSRVLRIGGTIPPADAPASA